MSEQDLMEYWLTEVYDYEQPQPGELREGMLIEVGHFGAMVDIGLKHDGIVPRSDIERLDQEVIDSLRAGQDIVVRVMQPQDQEGDLVLSLFHVQAERDWDQAEALLERKDVVEAEVTGSNKGGLLVEYRHLQGFVPASHLAEKLSHNLSAAERQDELAAYTGQTLSLKVIEVDRERNRLVLSERLAKEKTREHGLATLLEELEEGQVCRGVVRHLTDFGAFVNLGPADGLIHISELSWGRISHPRDVVQVGDEIDVSILNLDHRRQRIDLSLKRLHPNPWDQVDQVYTEGQLIAGKVTDVANYGAFIALEVGLEGLLHVSEIADPAPHDPREFVERGQTLVLRILKIDSSRQRVELSLKSVSVEERAVLRPGQQQSTEARPEEKGVIA